MFEQYLPLPATKPYNPLESRLIEFDMDDQSERRVTRFGFLGGVALFNPDQALLTPNQQLLATQLMLGYTAWDLANQQHVHRGVFDTKIRRIFQKLGLDQVAHPRPVVMPLLLASSIVELSTTSPIQNLPLTSGQLNLLGLMTTGENVQDIFPNTELGTSRSKTELNRLREESGIKPYELLVNGAIFTGQLVVNPPVTDVLLNYQTAVRIPSLGSQ